MREESEFEKELDCLIRYHSVPGDGVTERDSALACVLESCIRNFALRNPITTTEQGQGANR